MKRHRQTKINEKYSGVLIIKNKNYKHVDNYNVNIVVNSYNYFFMTKYLPPPGDLFTLMLFSCCHLFNFIYLSNCSVFVTDCLNEKLYSIQNTNIVVLYDINPDSITIIYIYVMNIFREHQNILNLCFNYVI